MKERCLLLILVVLLIPFVARAEDENNGDVTIESIELIEKTDDTTIKEEPTIVDLKIKFNIQFKKEEDYAKYKLVIKNNTDKVLWFDERELVNDEDYVSYSINYLDTSKAIKPNSDNVVILTLKYSKTVPSELFRSALYSFNVTKPLVLSNERHILIPNTLKTLSPIILILLISFITYGGYLLYTNKKLSKNSIYLLLLSLLVIPFITKAEYRIEISADSNFSIYKKVARTCTFDGDVVANTKYIDGQYTYTYYDNASIYNYVRGTGWGVELTDKESTDPVTTPVCATINDIPVISMNNMFANSNTSSIDLSVIDTSNVISMLGMFSNAKNLTSIDISTFETNKVQCIERMFAGAGMENLDLRNMDVSNMIVGNYLFTGMINLKTLNMDGWNISKMSAWAGFCNMLQGTLSLKKASLRDWKLPPGFWGICNEYYGSNTTSLEELDVTGWDLSNTTTISQALQNLIDLRKIVGLETWDTSNITDMYGLFQNDHSLDDVDLSSWDFSKVTNIRNMFNNCYFLRKLDMSTWDLSSANKTDNVMTAMYSLVELKTPNTMPQTDIVLPKDFYDSSNNMITTITPSTNSQTKLTVPKEAYMLEGQEFNIRIRDMSRYYNPGGGIFDGGIEHIKRTDTRAYPKYELMFSHYKVFVSTERSPYPVLIDFDTEHLTTTYYTEAPKAYLNPNNYYFMAYIDHLKTVDLSGFDSSKVETFSYFMVGCNYLYSADLSGLDTSNATVFTAMFENTGFKKLDLRNFDTSNGTRFYRMFTNMNKLEELDISSLDLKGAEYPESLLKYMPKLKYLTTPSSDPVKTFTLSNTMVDEDGNLYDYLDSTTPRNTKLKTLFRLTFIVGSGESVDIPYKLFDFENDKTYGELPTPVKEGYEFAGWYTGFEDGKHITSTTPITDPTSLELRPKWKQQETIFLNGNSFRSKINSLIDDYSTEYEVDGLKKIKHFKRERDASKVPSNLDEDDNRLSISGSKYPIWGWFDESSETFYYYTEEANPKTNEDAGDMFSGFKNAITIDISDFDFSLSTQLDNFFYNCESLLSADFTGKNLGNAYYLSRMFSGCNSLKNIKFDNIISNHEITYIDGMFMDCESLESIDIHLLDISTVRSISSIFKNCKKLKSVIWSPIDDDKLTYIDDAFEGCISLESVTTNWNTVNVDFKYTSIFENCKKLKSIDMSSFDIAKKINGLPGSVTLFENTYFDEIVTPKSFQNGNYFVLPKSYYQKGDSTPINRLDETTPAQTLLKSEPWD